MASKADKSKPAEQPQVYTPDVKVGGDAERIERDGAVYIRETVNGLVTEVRVG